jgi:TrmH family RNA methyltransferase
MGSIGRVSVHYTELSTYLQQTKLPVYAAVMDGENVYASRLPQRAILLMGNEANGISDTLMPFLNHQITIPDFSKKNTAESLNVATATGILLSEFRRNSETNS